MSKRPHHSIDDGVFSMVDQEDWERIKSELSAYDDARETVIKRSREIGKAGKNAIYSLHRGQQKEAAARLAAAETVAAELAPILEANPALRAGSYTNAVEEYAEARVFLGFLAERRLMSVAELSDKLALTTEEYLGGVLDFSGELNRWAIARATARDKAAVAQCRDLVDAIMGKFLDMDLRNGPLRRKFDALKYTLKRLETTLYELTLLEGGGKLVEAQRGDEAEPKAGAAAEGEDE